MENIESDPAAEKGDRRTGIERREFSFTAYAPERRCGDDRRCIRKQRKKERRPAYLENNEN
ncbi:MAG: hypothetical protein DSY89_03940 [Deltaproteobacteria bacterium]|nr:MAG: hypothetical protein DSY89_03940 [Deltaproteobacteria bacterium]